MFGYDPERDVVMGHEFVGEVVGHGSGSTRRLSDRCANHDDPVPIGRRRRWWLRSSGTIRRRPAPLGNCWSSLRRWRASSEGVICSDAVAVVDCFAVGEFYVRAAMSAG